MKYGKKILAVALAALLALSVLTGCSDGSGSNIDGKKLAEKLNETRPNSFTPPVEYDRSLDKTAKNAMRAIEAKVNTKTSDGTTIAMDNAIKQSGGTLLRYDSNREPYFTGEGQNLKTELEVEGTNKNKDVEVALIDTTDAKEEQYEIAQTYWKQRVCANMTSNHHDYSRMGYCASGHYILIVLVGAYNP